MKNKFYQLLLILAIGSGSVFAQAPKTLSYQGKLSDAGGPLNGTFNLKFTIYDAAAGGTSLWTETSNNVSVSGGNVAITLGKLTPINVQTDKPLWMGITVGSNPEISPRVELTGSLYSLGVALPYSAVSDQPISLFSITATADGARAGEFTHQGTNSGQAALFATSTGGNLAFQALNSGSNEGAASLLTTNSTNPTPTLRVFNSGLGSAVSLNGTNSSNSAPVLNINNSGTGNAITANGKIQATQFVGDGSLLTNLPSSGLSLPYSGSSNSGLAAFNISKDGSEGAAGSFFINNVNNSSAALDVSTTGTGRAGQFIISNTSTSEAALHVETNSTSAEAMRVYGASQAAAFFGNNSGNSVFVSSGSQSIEAYGPATFETTSGNTPALIITHSGTGRALVANAPIQATQFIGDGSLLTGLPSASLTLPYSGVTNNELTAFSINSGSANNSAANFSITGANNTAFAALNVSNAGSGRGIYSANVGTGSAGDFRVLNSANGSAVINAFTTGTGSAGTFSINNTSSSSPAISGVSSGNGAAGFFNAAGNGTAGTFQAMGGGRAIYGLINSSSNTSSGLDIQNFGAGRAAFFTTGNASNSTPVIEGTTNGSGSGLRLTLTNAGNPAAAINITHSGTGNAITANRPIQATQFIGDGSLLTGLPGMTLPFSGSSSSSSNAIDITTTGISSAARFSISNPTNSASALSVSTNGTGTAGTFSNSATSSQPSLFGISNSNTYGGKAVVAYQNGTGDNAALIRIANASNGNNSLWVDTNGLGNAIFANSISGAGVIGYANTTGDGIVGGSATGRGGYFYNTSNTNSTIVASQGGLGNTLDVNHSGAAGSIAVFKSNSIAQSRIDKTGKGFFNGGTQTGGADVAEMFDVEGARSAYEPGDVLVISESADRTVEKSAEPNSTRIAGVFATKPGVVLTERDIEEQLDDLVPMGVVGVIPTKVCSENGPIKRGDLLVTSSVAGHAMKAIPAEINGIKIYPTGAILGKALENFDGDRGLIKVLVNVK